MNLKAKWERRSSMKTPAGTRDYAAALACVLGRWNVCSKEYVVRQYDHEGRLERHKAAHGKYNDGPSDAGVVAPDLGSNNGVVVSHGICPKYSRFDTYNMVACALTRRSGIISRQAVL